jgi:hypothetical protein
LKPPPPPPISQIAPVPFHGGRSQRHNADTGYHYNPPSQPLQPPAPPSQDFKFPAPFYKQYNFNFVPPPQPFSSTPSPNLFQKVSGWLFPSQQTSYDVGINNQPQIKKDCNPCNLVPWIPVIRYDLGAKNLYQNPKPTYGPPSPTAYLDSQNVNDFKPQPFRSHQQDLPSGVPHAVYGPPSLSLESNLFNGPSSTYGPPVSTYGPPSPTHTVSIPSQNPITSTYSAPSSSFSLPSSTYGNPSTSFGHSSSTFGSSNSPQGFLNSPYSISSSSYTTPSSVTPSFSPSPLAVTYGAPVTTNYESELLNNQLPLQSDVEILKTPDLQQQLPRVSPPSSFKNSYGEAISSSFIADIPYSVSATAAESTKVKTEVLPNSSSIHVPNVSLALANPAPFTLNRGRNIHTLQPVALPNLSVSPLPPIFNARPFRPTHSSFLNNVVTGINSMQQSPNNIKIEQSVPLAEFTHSVDYPTSIIQSPIIDIDSPKQANQSKAYRNIPNAYILNEVRDISSQASEDHVQATKNNQDASFESTGADLGNDIYDSSMPIEFRPTRVPSNHKAKFADLRGVNDEDVDKYRTESNLQNIDSPLLYLKPSAPHKSYGNFILALSTTPPNDEYEIYDDIPTTASPQLSTLTSAWEESKTDYSDGAAPPTAAQESIERPKIVQIIVPYTNSKEINYNYEKGVENWVFAQEDKYQARKIPPNTESPRVSVTENYNIPSSTTEDSVTTVTENYDAAAINTAAILNDLYDVKEPPFDIIKLQHTIDDWTEQEYSEQHKPPQKNRGFEKYAKQIPDDYFTTTAPSTYATSNYNEYDYDHEGSSSNQHTVTDKKNSTFIKPYREYNTIERTKYRLESSKDEETKENQKLHIYTAASSFRRTTSTTPAPWGKILTSISPLTKEKVYVVTSKPWREDNNVTNDWYPVQPFESKKTSDTDDISSDNLPFKSPRFINRPSFGFSSDPNDAMNSESSYGFSRSWYQSSTYFFNVE